MKFYVVQDCVQDTKIQDTKFYVVNVFKIQKLCRLNESNETLWGTTSTNFPI